MNKGLSAFRTAAAGCILLYMSSFAPSGRLLSAAGPLAGVANGLPLPWTWTEIGPPQKPGTASWSSGTFTVTAAGADIGGSADEFGFAYQTLDGDGEIVAYVADLFRSHPWAKAGVMFRDELTRDAKYAAALVTADKGLQFQYRIAAGAGSTQIAGGSGKPPRWLRLSRRGQTFTAYASMDGTTWTMLGSEVVYLNRVAYVGLAVTSRSSRTPTTASFANVAVTATPSAPEGNRPPQVSITSPASGASFTSPTEIAIAATATDPDGTIARVDFYAGSTLIASDSASPYNVRWTGVPAGSYMLTAVATDNNGATTSSGGVSISVMSPTTPLPTFVIFVASADHELAVTSYTIEFFASGADPSTMAPVAIDDIGKPSPINGEIASDVTAIVQMLPAGSYFSTVTANGIGGTSRSAPSQTFVK